MTHEAHDTDADRGALYDVLIGYVASLHERHPLRLEELPTSVAVQASPLMASFVRELVFGMVENGREETGREETGREDDFRHDTARMTEAGCDPWNRQRRLLPSIAEFKPGIRRPLLEKWWAVVSHPDHAQAEVDPLPEAWARGAAGPEGSGSVVGGPDTDDEEAA